MADVKTEFNQSDISDTNGAVTTIVDGGNIRLATDSKVSGTITINSTPANPVHYEMVPLMNGAVENMNVNGSVTPQNFQAAPPAGQIWYLEQLSIIITDVGSCVASNYGALATLTNGCTLSLKVNGTERTVRIMKTNSHLSLAFSGPVIGQGGNNLWVVDKDGAIAYMLFGTPIALTGNTGDFVQYKISDNLTGLNSHFMTARIWRAV